MCGIAGIVASDGVPPELPAQMAATIEHRGPDDQGIWSDPSVGIALVHRRLSIVDLSPQGHQPMASADGRWVIVYNGEVYNHAALRAELGGKGRRARRSAGADTATPRRCFRPSASGGSRLRWIAWSACSPSLFGTVASACCALRAIASGRSRSIMAGRDGTSSSARNSRLFGFIREFDAEIDRTALQAYAATRPTFRRLCRSTSASTSCSRVASSP